MQVRDDDHDDDDDDDDVVVVVDDDDCSTKLQQNRAFRTNVIRNIVPISEITISQK